MALQMSAPTRFGVTVTYWRVITVLLDHTTDFVQATLAAYLDRDAREAGAEPAATKLFNFNRSDLGANEPGRPVIYAALKGLPEFADAVDV